ncbi:uncharacterized protein LACBIDRAFT_331241 [Laccaria bicolor S238N-H82]|uniref:Predicted protein n=1 Tax=Laccaria bicolor (strain S238N-H82 / ATCC MYA-4686) TaxID=486041 RepID=B0DNW5_LACBS|nr:uncharacterized protein LACBIDRAFT_331241 [Laccaria bicolor S238N-H82]EDR03795.1 predicted protein [Laccaria bicolor S238N-H82]|eukprot:XP_001885648.1 predicted protein [Laccaria bicolor S238N-H82]
MPLGSSTQLYSVYLNRIVFLRGDILTVWDFVADTLATWRVVGASHKTIIANDSILLFGSTCISVWNIPALLPRDHEHTTLPYVDVPIINPLFRIDYPECMPSLDDAIRTGSMIKGFGDWYTASAPWCYDIVLPSEAGFAISRYLVAFNKDMTGGTIKENACYEFMTTPDLDFFIEPYRVCDNQLVLSWTEGAWMECIIKTHTSTLSSQDTVTPRDDEPLILEEWKSNHFNGMSLFRVVGSFHHCQRSLHPLFRTCSHGPTPTRPLPPSLQALINPPHCPSSSSPHPWSPHHTSDMDADERAWSVLSGSGAQLLSPVLQLIEAAQVKAPHGPISPLAPHDHYRDVTASISENV